MSEFKTVLMIDVDSAREQQIMFSKPDFEKEPETREEAYTMVLNDVRCLTFGLATLIGLSHDNGFVDKNELLNQCIEGLKATIASMDESQEEESTIETKSESETESTEESNN